MDKLVEEIIAPFLDEIKRKDMPQVAGKDLEEMLAIFAENDINYRTANIVVTELRPTQEDYKPDKVKEMVAKLKSGEMDLHPIVVSNDGYIMDGHHRWLAAKELYGDKFKMKTIVIDLPQKEALDMFSDTADQIDENIINENPDMIYDKDGNEILHHSKGGVPFGYYKGKMYVGAPNTHHRQMKDIYPDMPEFEDTGWNEHDPEEIWGRFWPEQKVISFWKQPKPDELIKLTKEIEAETELPVKFDNSWKVDADEQEAIDPETFDMKITAQQFPLDKYEDAITHQAFVCTTEGKIPITEEVILAFLEKRDFPKIIKEASKAAAGEVDDGPAMFYRALSKYRDDVIPVAEQAGLVVLDYIISKFDEDDFSTKFRYEVVPVVSYGSTGAGHTKADNQVAKYREHITPAATSVGFEIIDFLGVDLYDVQGVSVNIPQHYQRDKMLAKYDRGDTFADDTRLDESVIKKINGIDFEFKYNEHEVEPFFTVLRDGVPVDRMPATLSKPEMKAFMQKNFSRWMADYVKSYGADFNQIPQHGRTHGVYTGLESKQSFIDITPLLE